MGYAPLAMDQTLKCRRCKVAANAVVTNKEVQSITCPTCGAHLQGQEARTVYRNLIRYQAQKKTHEVFSSSSNKAKSSGVVFKPGPKPKDPGSPFTF